MDNNSSYTKFYVFAHQEGEPPLPGGDLPLSLAVDLDKNGKKFVPGVCVACHGGDTYPGGNPVDGNEYLDNPNIGTHFLPFDLHNFIYLNTQTFSRGNQEGKFRRLNQLVREVEANPTGAAAIRDLIDGWYSGGRLTQYDNFVPLKWEEDEELYKKVVRNSCRTCHVAMRSPFEFDSFEEFKDLASRTKLRVCDNHEMPNAVMTFDLFWLSQHSQDKQKEPHQPDILREFLDQQDNGEIDGSVTCPEP